MISGTSGTAWLKVKGELQRNGIAIVGSFLELLSEHNKPAAEVDECHVTMLIIDTSRKRIERFDPYAHVAETDPLLQPVIRMDILWRGLGCVAQMISAMLVRTGGGDTCRCGA